MREILFRGKRVDNGEWVQGTYYHQTEFYGDKCDYHYIIETCDELEDNMMIFSKVIPETIGQYTGVTDKNGNKIFEGDIITAEIYEREYEDEYLSNTPIQVTYCSGYFYPFHLEGCWRSGVSNITVIGNIHDNPELLKECKHNDK